MVVDFKVIDDENEADDDTVPLQKSTEDKVMSTPTTNKVMIFMELVKTFLLFVIWVILGLLLRPPPPPRDFTSGGMRVPRVTVLEHPSPPALSSNQAARAGTCAPWSRTPR